MHDDKTPSRSGRGGVVAVVLAALALALVLAAGWALASDGSGGGAAPAAPTAAPTPTEAQDITPDRGHPGEPGRHPAERPRPRRRDRPALTPHGGPAGRARAGPGRSDYRNVHSGSPCKRADFAGLRTRRW